VDRGVRNTLLWIAAFISLVLGLLFARYVVPHGPSSGALRELGYYEFDNPVTIKPFALVDHRGRQVDNTVLQGRWTLMFFGFTWCPDVCPTTLAVLDDAVQRLPAPPQVILVSVDPERDTPPVLARYVTSFNERFVGLTGTFDDIVGLATQVNIAFAKMPGEEPGTYTVDHSASIVVIDPQGRYRGFIKAPHKAQSLIQIAGTFR